MNCGILLGLIEIANDKGLHMLELCEADDAMRFVVVQKMPLVSNGDGGVSFLKMFQNVLDKYILRM